MELIPEAVIRVADRLKVLGQPVRLRLIEQLTKGSSTPQEMSDSLGLSQQTVSKHLLNLRRAGIVSRQPEGANVIYALVDDTAVAVLRLTLASVTRQLGELSQLAWQPIDDREPGEEGWRGAGQASADCRPHNPKVAGSNPAPAIPADQARSSQERCTPADRDLKGHRKVAFVVPEDPAVQRPCQTDVKRAR